MKKTLIILLAISFLFLFSRLYKIDTNPPSLYWDEASIGYNAYSITQDGRDEWGEFLPLHFRAFGEFKLPVYIYSVSLMSYLFGLTALSVRLPAVFFGLGSILVVYFLAKEITGKRLIAIMSSFILAFTPWLFIFSRTGYEATAGLFFYLMGVYLFLKSKSSKWLILASFISFILSMYSYNSFRIISLLSLVVLSIYEYTEVKDKKKYLKILSLSFLILFISLTPLYKLYTQDYGNVRFQQVSLQGNSQEKVAAFAKNYVSHFSPSFLFINGDTNPRSQIPGYGQMFIITLPLLIIGLYAAIKSKNKKTWLLVIFLLISILPASITKESPHALRSISAAVFISIISAMGIYFIYEAFKKRDLIIVLILLLYSISFTKYYLDFNNNYARKYSQEWQYEYKMVFKNYNDEISKYNKVIISDQYTQPYIFALYYLKYDPNKFRAGVEYNTPDKWGKSIVKSFGSYEFGKVSDELVGSNTLLFTENKIDKEGVDLWEEIQYLSGDTALYIYNFE